MVHAQQFVYGYTSRKQVFSIPEFSLPEGSIIGLLGRNGEGKTTLMKTLIGQLFAEAKQLDVLGFDPRKRKVGFLQQVFLLPEEVKVPAVTIRRFFDLYAPFYPTYDSAVAEELVRDFSLDWSMELNKCSQGQCKKALIAFALSLRVPFLLLDEPTNGLDIPSKGEFRRALARYAGEEQTVLISTHQVRDLEALIDHLVILDGGKLICNSSLGDISERIYCGRLTPEEEAEALYSEASPVGVVGVRAPHEGEYSEYQSLELLFNAFIAHPAEAQRLLSAPSSSSL